MHSHLTAVVVITMAVGLGSCGASPTKIEINPLAQLGGPPRTEPPSVYVLVHEVEVEEGCDPSRLKKELQRSRSKLAFCHERSFHGKTPLYGAVVVSWTIDESGYPQERAITQNASGSPHIEHCVKRHAIKYRYKSLPRTGVCKVRARIEYKDPTSYKTNRGPLYELRSPTRGSWERVRR